MLEEMIRNKISTRRNWYGVWKILAGAMVLQLSFLRGTPRHNHKYDDFHDLRVLGVHKIG
jgi:hypothetical protein